MQFTLIAISIVMVLLGAAAFAVEVRGQEYWWATIALAAILLNTHNLIRFILYP